MSSHSLAFISFNTSESFGDIPSGDDDNISDGEDYSTVTSDTLTISLLICSSANLTVIFLYWAYLIYSSFTLNTTWALIFPHLLLLGLFLGSSSSLAHITLDPTSMSSCSTSLLVPISYSMIYSTLLVRLVYLHSLHKDMYRLSTLYQTLLLLFCVLVQVSVSTQSLLLTQLTACPSHTSIYSTPITDLLSLSYSCFMLLLITCISTMLRRRKEYREEAWSIWVLSILSMAVWMVWVATALVFENHYRVVKGKSRNFFVIPF